MILTLRLLHLLLNLGRERVLLFLGRQGLRGGPLVQVVTSVDQDVGYGE